MAGFNFTVGEVESMREKKASDMHLFEVQFKNRIIKKLGNKPIRGTQGRWYPEECVVLAENESDIKGQISDKLKSRRMLGIKGERKSQLRREIKIQNTRRLA
jgi:hypothetical protein